jgi:hypothetical protein
MLIETKTHRENFMRLDEVAALPEFAKLNPSQRRFVIDYIGAGLVSGTYDAVEAVKWAYGHEMKNAKIRAHQILNNKQVRHVLNMHFRRSEIEIILSDLQRAAKKSVRLGVGLTPETAKALIAFEQYVSREKTANV